MRAAKSTVDHLFIDIMKPNALPWRVDKWIEFKNEREVGAQLRIMGWYSHKWKADRAVRRAFGGFEMCSVTKVPGDQYVSMWRGL